MFPIKIRLSYYSCLGGLFYWVKVLSIISFYSELFFSRDDHEKTFYVSSCEKRKNHNHLNLIWNYEIR